MAAYELYICCFLDVRFPSKPYTEDVLFFGRKRRCTRATMRVKVSSWPSGDASRARNARNAIFRARILFFNDSSL